MKVGARLAVIATITCLVVGACVAGQANPTPGIPATPASGSPNTSSVSSAASPNTSSVSSAASPNTSSMSSGVSAAAADTSLSGDANLSKEVAVPAGGSIDVPLSFEGSATASVTVFGAATGVTASFAGTSLTEDSTVTGRALGVTLSSPSDGSLRLTNSGASDATVSVLVFIQTTRHLTVTASAATVNMSGSVNLEIALSQPVAGDVVQAELIDPAGTHTPISMTDTGGGSWTGQVTPSVGGTNHIRVWTTGHGVRYGVSTVEVRSGTVTIGTGFTASANDTNSNGLADTLVLTPTITIGQAGTYEIDADLVDGSGTFVARAKSNPATSTGWYDLTAGTQQLALTFDGSTIYKSSLSGPYHLDGVTISRIVDGNSHPEAYVADMGATQAYDYHVFEHPGLPPMPSVSCSGCTD